MKNDFSSVEIYPKDHSMEKPWFVAFTFTDPMSATTKRFQYRGEINKKKSLKERIKEANSLKSALEEMLFDGWNPFNGFMEHEKEAKYTPLVELMDKLLQIKKSSIKPKSYRNYYDSIRWFKLWLSKTGKKKMYPGHFTNIHARAYVDYMMLEKNYNGKTINGQVSYLKSFFYMMVEREVIQKNPFFGIKKLRHDIGKNIAFSHIEKVKIAEKLRIKNINLYYFVQFMYHCFLRRSEIIRIKVGDIDWINKTIRVNSEDTKNRRQESVAIPSGLEAILEQMQLKDYSPNYYIFSHRLKPGKQMLVKADHITAIHKQILKSLNIPYGKTLYSWKHTGVVDYYNAIHDPYPIMQQLRHHSLSITMVYLKSLGLQPNSMMRDADIKL